ncbi:MAG TPA: hypothetical protein DC017_18275 [Candidatus Wallbacteria bacterium]|nr:hypothetical protein [Candidatus Wallbacteria bacterium]
MKWKVMFTLVLAAAAASMFSFSAPARASESDEKIVSSFKDTYVYKVYLKDDQVNAESKDGIVTLSGTVAEEYSKTLAEETAMSLPGVTSVDNKIAIKAEAAAEKSDAWIGGKIKLALLFHRKVSGFKTAVDVKDGIVTLKGEASSIAQKELTAEYAKDIDGVKEVKNEMTVAAAPEPPETEAEKIDDASINAQVKLALSTHRSTIAVKTGIDTHIGEVTLTGAASSSAEISMVTKLVEDIHGVTGVKNEMTVSAGAPADPANTATNVRDRNDQTLTPLDQGSSTTDVEITTKIRRSIIDDSKMSVNARNVKIITIDGKVTMRGPVNTADEKSRINEIAEQAAKPGNVDNQLEVNVAPAGSNK